MKPTDSKRMLWEILIPANLKGSHIPKTQHHLWDQFAINLTNGLTIYRPASDSWKDSLVVRETAIFREQMIPVRIYATHDDMKKIVEFTLIHYQQAAVMYYVIGVDVRITTAAELGISNHV